MLLTCDVNTAPVKLSTSDGEFGAAVRVTLCDPRLSFDFDTEKRTPSGVCVCFCDFPSYVTVYEQFALPYRVIPVPVRVISYKLQGILIVCRMPYQRILC